MNDDEVLRFMVGGQRPRLRRDDRRGRAPSRTEIVSIEACEGPYQELLWQQARFATLEELRLEEFAWATAGVSYDHAAAWYRQGAGWMEKHLVFALAAAGLTPDDTVAWWSYSERGPNVTIMEALLSEQVTVEQVRRMKQLYLIREEGGD